MSRHFQFRLLYRERNKMPPIPSLTMLGTAAARIFSSSYMKSEMVIYSGHDHTKTPTRHPKAEPGTQNIRTPPEIQVDVGRMRWAINEAAGIKQRFGSIRPSQKTMPLPIYQLLITPTSVVPGSDPNSIRLIRPN